MHHAERKTSERDSEAERVRHQVRLEELRRAVRQQQTHGRADRQTGDARQDERRLIAPELGNELARGLLDRHYRSFALSSAGMSASVACSLNCSARIYAAIAQRSRASTCCR